MEPVNGKKTTSLSKAGLCIYAKKVFSLNRVIAVEMKTACFLVSLGFFFVKIGLPFEFDTISISTVKKQKSRHSFKWLNKNCYLGVKTPPHILAVEEVMK